MIIKPFGLCGKCLNRNTCEVVTETNAKVLECPDLNKDDLRDLNSQPYKMTKKLIMFK